MINRKAVIEVNKIESSSKLVNASTLQTFKRVLKLVPKPNYNLAKANDKTLAYPQLKSWGTRRNCECWNL